MVDGDKLGEVGFKYLGVSYDKMDCQAFVEQCLRDCGLDKNLAGSNAWFREVNKNGAIMTPEECVKELGTVPKGAFLFILEHDGGEPEKYKPDGLGNASHIGLVTGRGEGAIHSSASRGCVAESKFKNKTINGGWNRVGLWDKVSYDYGTGGGGSDPDVSPTPDPTPEPERQMMVFAENGKPVNMRTKPDLNAPLVDRIDVGCIVDWIKEDGTGWAYIRYGSKKGWMMECYLVDPETDIDVPEDDEDPADPGDGFPDDEGDPEPEILTVWAANGKPVKLRQQPSEKCNLYDDLPVGEQVELVSYGDKWCQVNYKNRKGWYMMTQFLSRG